MSQVGKRRKDPCKGPPGLAEYATCYSASLQADIAEFQGNLSMLTRSIANLRSH